MNNEAVLYSTANAATLAAAREMATIFSRVFRVNPRDFSRFDYFSHFSACFVTFCPFVQLRRLLQITFRPTSYEIQLFSVNFSSFLSNFSSDLNHFLVFSRLLLRFFTPEVLIRPLFRGSRLLLNAFRSLFYHLHSFSLLSGHF